MAIIILLYEINWKKKGELLFEIFFTNFSKKNIPLRFVFQ